MRLASTILFILLIAKTSVGMELKQFFSMDCCSSEYELVVESIDMEHSEDDNDENNCCDLGNCDCACCAHIMISQKQVYQDFEYPESNFIVDFHYDNNYKLLYQNLVFHPPKLV